MGTVVTGATSFIGAAVVKELLEQKIPVAAVVRPGSKNIQYLWKQVPPESRHLLWVVELDLKQIGRIAEKLPEETTWESWLHAGWDGAGSDNRTKGEVQQANVVFSLEAVKAAGRLGCRRFLFTGSQAEYGIHNTVITEDTPLNPVSEYAKAKVSFANSAKDLCKLLEMEYIHTRIFSVYGPGDHPWSLVNTCLATWAGSGHMQLGPCTQKWNFLYIEDTARALVLLLKKGEAGTYNVAGDDTRVLRQFIEEMYELCGSTGSFVYGEKKPNAEGAVSLDPDIGRLKSLGWTPTTLFAEGIYETMRCLRGSS